MGKNKKFNKNGKDVHHFRLVHRAGAEEAGGAGLVLEGYVPPNVAKRTGEVLPELPDDLERLGPEVFGHLGSFDPPDGSDDDEDDDDLDEEELFGTKARKPVKTKVDTAELEGDCYFPKDGYDYSKHLRSFGATGATVITTEPVNEPKKTPAPRTTVEGEVEWALDEAEVFDEADDDFLAGLVDGGAVAEDKLLWNDGNAVEPEEVHFAQDLLADDLFDDMSNDGLQIPRAAADDATAAQLNELLKEYDEDEIGELSEPETEEGEDREKALEKCAAIAEEFLEDKKKEQELFESLFNPHEREHELDDNERPVEKTKELAERYCHEDSDDDDTSIGDRETTEKDTWDCESILSTHSNLSNHPGKIIRPKVIARKKAHPKVETVLEDEAEEDRDSEAENKLVELLDVNTERPKDETPEERKLRKAGVKQMRRQCRQMKKESKETYKKEGARLGAAHQCTVDVRPQVRTVRL